MPDYICGFRMLKRWFLVLKMSCSELVDEQKKVAISFRSSANIFWKHFQVYVKHSKFNSASSNTHNLTHYACITWKTHSPGHSKSYLSSGYSKVDKRCRWAGDQDFKTSFSDSFCIHTFPDWTLHGLNYVPLYMQKAAAPIKSLCFGALFLCAYLHCTNFYEKCHIWVNINCVVKLNIWLPHIPHMATESIKI